MKVLEYFYEKWMIVKLVVYSIKMLCNYKVFVDEFGIFKGLNLSIESIDGFNFIEIFKFFLIR